MRFEDVAVKMLTWGTISGGPGPDLRHPLQLQQSPRFLHEGFQGNVSHGYLRLGPGHIARRVIKRTLNPRSLS